MHIDQQQLVQDILSWSEQFLETPHPALGDWPPCPYARAARLKGTVGIFVGQDLEQDLRQRCDQGMENWEVAIYAYDPNVWSWPIFNSILEKANQDFLVAHDLIALEDHPHDRELVNGVAMNQGTYALAMIQSLSDLDRRARVLANKGFYQTWHENYLQVLFRHRQDPRKPQ
jgi:hypothetical protein